MLTTDHLLIDLLRLVLAVAALVLAGLVGRLAWVRRQSGYEFGTHPATYASYAIALVLMAALRLTHAGDPPTWDLWVACVVVGLGWYGVTTRVAFRFDPPWRR